MCFCWRCLERNFWWLSSTLWLRSLTSRRYVSLRLINNKNLILFYLLFSFRCLNRWLFLDYLCPLACCLIIFFYTISKILNRIFSWWVLRILLAHRAPIARPTIGIVIGPVLFLFQNDFLTQIILVTQQSRVLCWGRSSGLIQLLRYLNTF